MIVARSVETTDRWTGWDMGCEIAGRNEDGMSLGCAG